MWSTLGPSAEIFWQSLPDITVAIRFVTALVGLVSTSYSLRRQMRRRKRRRVARHQQRNQQVAEGQYAIRGEALHEETASELRRNTVQSNTSREGAR